MNHLKKWWPALLAIWMVYICANVLTKNYPHLSKPIGKNAQDVMGIDSVLTAIKNNQVDKSMDSLQIGRDPFGNGRHFANVVSVTHAPSAPPPPRHYILKGTIGDKVATITNNAGRKNIVKVGDKIDSAFVLSIAPNRVELKDRAGTFELLLQK
jgi:hypothetical protein